MRTICMIGGVLVASTIAVVLVMLNLNNTTQQQSSEPGSFKLTLFTATITGLPDKYDRFSISRVRIGAQPNEWREPILLLDETDPPTSKLLACYIDWREQRGKYQYWLTRKSNEEISYQAIGGPGDVSNSISLFDSWNDISRAKINLTETSVSPPPALEQLIRDQNTQQGVKNSNIPSSLANLTILRSCPPNHKLQAWDLTGGELDLLPWLIPVQSGQPRVYVLPFNAKFLSPKAQSTIYDLVEVGTDNTLVRGERVVRPGNIQVRTKFGALDSPNSPSFQVRPVQMFSTVYSIALEPPSKILNKVIGQVALPRPEITFRGIHVNMEDGKSVKLGQDIADGAVGVKAPRNSAFNRLVSTIVVRPSTEVQMGELQVGWHVPPLTIKLPSGGALTLTEDKAHDSATEKDLADLFVMPAGPDQYIALVQAALSGAGDHRFEVRLKDAHPYPGAKVEFTGGSWELDLSKVSEKTASIVITGPQPKRRLRIPARGWILRTGKENGGQKWGEVGDSGGLPFRVLRAADGLDLWLHPPVREPGLEPASVRYKSADLERSTFDITVQPKALAVTLSPAQFEGFAPAVLVETRSGDRFELLGETDRLGATRNTIRHVPPNDPVGRQLERAEVQLTFDDIAAVTPLSLASFGRTPVTPENAQRFQNALRNRSWSNFFTSGSGLDVYCPSVQVVPALRPDGKPTELLNPNPLSSKYFSRGATVTGQWWNGLEWAPLPTQSGLHLRAAAKAAQPDTVYVIISLLNATPARQAARNRHNTGTKDEFDKILEKSHVSRPPSVGATPREMTVDDVLAGWHDACPAIREELKRIGAAKCRVAIAYAKQRNCEVKVGPPIEVSGSDLLSRLQNAPNPLMELEHFVDLEIDTSPTALVRAFANKLTEAVPGSLLLVTIPEGDLDALKENPPGFFRQRHLYGFARKVSKEELAAKVANLLD